jgi:LysM repeat protein
MTVEGPVRLPRADQTPGLHVATDVPPGALPALCPYLATPDGSWRSARPVREHQCQAVNPPVPLAIEKQRRLCLVDAHIGCATYGAAVAARAEPLVRHAEHLRPVARMTPVILDHGRFDLRVPSMPSDRASQAVLVGVLGVAFVAILIARPADPAGAGPLDGSPTPAVSVAPSNPATAAPTNRPATPSGSPVPSEAPSDSPDPTASAPAASADPVAATPRATPAPSLSGETYRVRSGDTLTAIAARFGTTPQVLAELNDIADPSNLRIGQILILP